MDAKQHQELFFHLLRQSMGLAELTHGQQETLTDEDWQWLYEEAERQSLTGVMCGAVTQLPAGQRPPLNLMIK